MASGAFAVRAYFEVPHGNAKSTLSSALALYMLAADGEGGAEVYSLATTRDQARIVFGDAQTMARQSSGFRTRFGCIDELHAHKTRTVYDVVETGTGKRDDSLLWVITTAGSNRSGSCYEIRSFVTRLLDGVLADNSQFGIVYGLDDDDWTPSGAQGQRLQPDRGQPPRRDRRTDAGPPGPDPHGTDAVR
jgi:phage terminase large subunit-like protein